MSIGSESLGFACQPRDIAILCEVAESRAIKLAHIAQLHFDGRWPAMYKRLSALRRAGLIAVDHAHVPAAPALVRITQPGYRVLLANGSGGRQDAWPTVQRRQQVRPAVIAHELGIMDVKVAFRRALSTEGGAVTFATTGQGLAGLCPPSRRFDQEALRPDAFITITHQGRESRFFLELDQSTQAERIIHEKAIAYRRLYRSGAFARAMGGSYEVPEAAPFRILFVCRTAARRDNLAQGLLTLVPPVRTQCIFATLADVIENTLGPIWRTPHSLAGVPQSSEGGEHLIRLTI